MKDSTIVSKGRIYALRFIALLALATGLGDMVGGVQFLRLAGAAIPKVVAIEPTLNSQIAFWGAYWFGFGAMMWWASMDVVGRVGIVRMLLAIFFLSGMARSFSAVRYGFPITPLVGAMAVELILAPLLLFQFNRSVPMR